MIRPIKIKLKMLFNCGGIQLLTFKVNLEETCIWFTKTDGTKQIIGCHSTVAKSYRQAQNWFAEKSKMALDEMEIGVTIEKKLFKKSKIGLDSSR